MSFKLTKTIDAEINSNGICLGKQQVTVEISYSISAIQLVAEGKGIATICAAINESPPGPVDSVPFTYELNGDKGIFEQAEEQVRASSHYSSPQ